MTVDDAAVLCRRRFVAGDVTVDADAHTLTGRLVPWEQTVTVVDPTPTGVDRYREVWTAGAFDEQLADTDGARLATVELRTRHGGDPAGYLLAAAGDETGLTGRFRIKPSAWDDVATMVADGITGLSIEFVPAHGGTVYGPAGLRRRTRARLVAVALEPVPAYPDARVLAVRSAPDVADAVDEHAAAVAANAARVARWRDRFAPLTDAPWRTTSPTPTEE